MLTSLLSLRSKRDAGLKMRNSRRDRLEISGILEGANEEG